MPAVKIALLNQKGGVGKSSTCHHLGGTFAKMGHRVLLVDLDPQSSLTQGFWGPATTRALPPERTIDAAFRAGASASQVIHPTGIEGIDIIPGSRHAAEFNTPMPQRAPGDDQFAIRGLLGEVEDDYSMILCDCPPNLYLCSWSALVASDHIIVPLCPEDYAAQGLIDVQESIAMVKAGPNPRLNLLGFLVGMKVARKAMHQLHEEKVREEYGDLVFLATIPEASDYAEAISYRKPVSVYKPRGAATKAMKALADEVLARIAGDRVGTALEAA